MDTDADKDLMWIARAGLKAAKSLLSAQPLSPDVTCIAYGLDSWIFYENWNESIR